MGGVVAMTLATKTAKSLQNAEYSRKDAITCNEEADAGLQKLRKWLAMVSEVAEAMGMQLSYQRHMLNDQGVDIASAAASA